MLWDFEIVVGLSSFLAIFSAAAREVLSGRLVMEVGKETGSFPCRPLPPLPGCGAGAAGVFTQALTAAHQSG